VAWVGLNEIGDYRLPDLQVEVIGQADQQRRRAA
jgi:hypothetical protein